MVPTLGGGTQDTDFNTGFNEGILTTNLRRNAGGSGGPRPPSIKFKGLPRWEAWRSALEVALSRGPSLRNRKFHSFAFP